MPHSQGRSRNVSDPAFRSMARAVLLQARYRHLPGARARPGRSQMTAKRWKAGGIRLGAVLALVLGPMATAQPAEAQSTDLVFAVTEGVTYQATPKEIRDKFEPLAQVIGKALNRNVRLVLVPAYDDARAGLAKQEFDVAFIHPAHVALAEVKAHRYASVAWTSGFTEYTVSLLTTPDRPWKELKDIRSQTLVTPDPDSITA